jgi:hypothetical protein
VVTVNDVHKNIPKRRVRLEAVEDLGEHVRVLTEERKAEEARWKS